MVNRVQIFGINFDCLRFEEAVNTLFSWIDERREVCRYVITPNVDHVVKYQDNKALQAAYAEADMVLVDGKPVLWAARLLGKPILEVIPGSDLCPALFEAAGKREQYLRVFLLGASKGVAEQAKKKIEKCWPWVDVCGFFTPPQEFSVFSPETEMVITEINRLNPDLIIIGLGAPKQEIWIHSVQHKLQSKIVICAGATIDFIAGNKKRAPIWMRRIGLEWLHRTIAEPKRLLGRYLYDAWVFPRLVFREFQKNDRKK